jgi:predicted dehydrogenase
MARSSEEEGHGYSSKMISPSKLFLSATLAAFFLPSITEAQPTPPIRVAVVGLTHGHVQGFLHNLPAHPEIQLVGISEPDAALRQHYIDRTHLPATLFFPTEAAMLQGTHPQAILVYTSTAGHRAAIEQAAPLHIAAMVEKPLATTVEDAVAIQQLAQKYNIPVLTNYETTWYNSNTAAVNLLNEGKIGELRKLVIHDGHSGPKEISVGPEFLSWLTDPKQNGGGALFDFGCYGVDLATWIMHGELPTTVTDVTLHLKPQTYPNVDDDSTIILTYPHAQAIIQGSWNWPFSRKDMEIYGATGYVDTLYEDHNPGAKLRIRLPGEVSEHIETAPALTPPQNDSLTYLTAVLGGSLKSQHDLTSLDTNVTVVRILDAARRSAQTGRTIHLATEKASSTTTGAVK